MIDIRQSENYANYLTVQGWIVERINNISYSIKKMPLIGSVLKIQRPEKLEIDVIRKLAKKYRSFQIIIEPKNYKDANLLASIGYKLAKSTYLPSKTLQIDLTQSMVKIFNSFKKDARASIKRGETIKVKEYSSPNDVKEFRDGWRNCVNFKRFVPSYNQLINLRKSFPQNHSMFLASHNKLGSIIGGAIFTISSHERSNYITYYWQAFTNSEGRTSLSQYALLYQGILWAKEQGCKVFDFEGIYDERSPNKSWLGFSHFKKSFGGYEVIYPGTYVKNRLPL